MTLDPIALVVVVLGYVGIVLVLSEVRPFRRPTLLDRISPYARGAIASPRLGVLSVASFREVLAPLAREIGDRGARLAGVGEDLGERLRRVHSPLDPTAFRIRQVGLVATTLLAAAALSAVATPPLPLTLLVLVGAPLLSFLVPEQRLAAASGAHQRALFLELPVVSEQLAMLSASGWSLGTAMARIAARGTGACASDLARVVHRTSQGMTQAAALREWAEIADVDAVGRLVSVLVLNGETADLGRLIAAESRAIRREAHRETIEAIERRAQQVWIPVTVAALVPGALLMGVPFVDALTVFAAT